MSEAQKDTIYIDVDDEITTIIDKVQSSPHKIVALVLPKRATVLQSIINMKLLKRNADKSKKNLVLITSESGLMPLAGAVGLHVAKNLQSKPEIPAGPDKAAAEPVDEDELESGEEEPELDNKKSIGELAGATAAGAAAGAAVAASRPEPEETLEMDDAEPAAGDKASKAKPKKDKNLKVPNFERFRKWLILGGVGLVALIVGGYFAFKVMPRAHIVITTDTTTLNSTINFTANTANKTFDEQSKQVPGEWVTTKKTDTQTAPATGQKNNGTKATGSLTMTAKVCNSLTQPASVPAGTGVSANGLTYITQDTVTFTFSNISGGCINYTSNGTNITAQNGGTNYNTASTSFAVAGRTEITATGSANGGTDNIVKVVSQADVDGAKAKLNNNGADTAKSDLAANLKKDGMYAITSSFTTTGPDITTTPKVGDQADTVSVTGTTTYTMLGVNNDNLTQLVNNQLKTQIDTTKQAVQDDGLGSATFTVNGKDNPQVSTQTSATIGPNVDTNAIKKEIAGKKKAETIDIISNRPSIKSVTVNYSPFWVTKTPSDPNKVIIVFQKAN